ncbi:MAG: cysteine desulfurase NifS [Clostridia bacterium]|nr:cysteine desulfurase NifS [Clostridia bacterium]
MNKIYLDNAATTPLSSEVLNEMMPYLTGDFGNPNSLHSFGRTAKSAIELARERIARAIGCEPSEVYFTSGATESNNWALNGIAKANRHKGNHIITSKIEHPSILETCKKLEREGFRVTYLDVDEMGLVRIDQLLHYIGADTILISIMSANNEVGTIQNIQAIANIAKEKNVIFHTDATQAVGAVSFSVREMGIDAMSISGHKLNGPKGVGALYVHDGVVITPFMNGGEQESGLRAGTSNVPGIVGLGKAVEIATRDIMANSKKVRELRDYFIKKVVELIPMTQLNGHPVQRLPNNINLSFGMVEGESLMYLLDLNGIAVSTGSACSSGSVENSHVLSAMGIAPDLAQGAVRFSLGRNTTKQDIEYVIEKLVECVEKLRKISAMSKSQVGKEDE